jgi:hypothetical protein
MTGHRSPLAPAIGLGWGMSVRYRSLFRKGLWEVRLTFDPGRGVIDEHHLTGPGPFRRYRPRGPFSVDRERRVLRIGEHRYTVDHGPGDLDQATRLVSALRASAPKPLAPPTGEPVRTDTPAATPRCIKVRHNGAVFDLAFDRVTGCVELRNTDGRAVESFEPTGAIRLQADDMIRLGDRYFQIDDSRRTWNAGFS